MTNGAYGSRSHGGHKSDRDVRFFDAPDRRGSGHGLYSSYGSNRYHGYHLYHPYRRSDKGYLSDELKK